MKVTEKILQWQTANRGKPFFSVEFFPPKTDLGVVNLFDRFDRFAGVGPLWFDVTWGAGGSTATRTMEVCQQAVLYNGMETMMHLTCTNMPKSSIAEALSECKKRGIQNILALRGDPPSDGVDWKACEGGFEHAVDLVKYIRETHGDYFCIGVAGYPEGHLENPDTEDDLRRLKEKVDAGADLVLTQLFYDVPIFQRFVERAKAIGITIPIVPGIMPIQSYMGFKKMTTFCKTFVPPELEMELEKIKDDDQKVKDFGVEHGVKLCRELTAVGCAGFHFYTLNLEVTVMRILEELNLADLKRELPWKPMLGDRAQEDVRPIFWSNRPKSYIRRTAQWDDFPNGRWGTRESPAFGEVFVSASFDPEVRSAKQRREMWGQELTEVADVSKAFVGYLKSGVPKRLPWCNEIIGEETNLIKAQILKLNRIGLLTINSQPRVNCALSTDPIHGWGPENGFIFQKAYVEFFCSQEILDVLLLEFRSQSNYSYMAVNSKGVEITNVRGSVNAVTWGVFGNSQIKQPTIVDFESFLAWKDEAFALWEVEWGSLYEAGSKSRSVIHDIGNTWYLVNVVDNNFVTGDLFGHLLRLFGTFSLAVSPKSERTTTPQTPDSDRPVFFRP